MMAFPIMLVEAAKKEGMAIPPNPDRINKHKYPHFWIFCQLQLGRRIEWGEHWDNARVIARIPAARLKKMTLEDFIAAGLRYSL